MVFNAGGLNLMILFDTRNAVSKEREGIYSATATSWLWLVLVAVAIAIPSFVLLFSKIRGVQRACHVMSCQGDIPSTRYCMYYKHITTPKRFSFGTPPPEPKQPTIHSYHPCSSFLIALGVYLPTKYLGWSAGRAVRLPFGKARRNRNVPR